MSNQNEEQYVEVEINGQTLNRVNEFLEKDLQLSEDQVIMVLSFLVAQFIINGTMTKLHWLQTVSNAEIRILQSIQDGITKTYVGNMTEPETDKKKVM